MVCPDPVPINVGRFSGYPSVRKKPCADNPVTYRISSFIHTLLIEQLPIGFFFVINSLQDGVYLISIFTGDSFLKDIGNNKKVFLTRV